MLVGGSTLVRGLADHALSAHRSAPLDSSCCVLFVVEALCLLRRTVRDLTAPEFSVLPCCFGADSKEHWI
jgi:hypothetical protein